jgi:thiol-disulfide isomerase/thioredoxin
MNDKKFLILAVVLAALLLTLSLLKMPGKITNKDAIKFKEEYENLNGKTNENSKKKYRTVKIDSKNKIVYSNAKEVLKMMEEKKSFVVYFGFDSCPWCRSVVENVSKISKELDEDIYYVDVKEIRDVYELDDENKPELTKEGDKNYLKLIKKLDSVLKEYTLTTDDDNEVKVGEKRIYAPNIVSIIDGSAKELTTGLSDKQTDGYITLTDEMKQESYKKIKKIVQEVVNHNNTCDLDKGC